jgi:hypothetical protein
VIVSKTIKRRIRMKSKIINIFIVAVFLVAVLSACGNQKNTESMNQTTSSKTVIVPDKKIELWNGKDFNGWVRYIPDTSVDVDKVWFVKDGNLHCSGVPNGYIKTTNSYANYKLTVEWRWPAEPGNSGVLLHMSEPDTVWPKCIEAQLQSTNAGDFYVIGGTTLKEQVDKSNRRVEKKEESSENPPGEWNTYKIICKDDQIRLTVNGVLQNVGSEASVQSGKICFQSEGKPIEFKAIYLEPLN